MSSASTVSDSVSSTAPSSASAVLAAAPSPDSGSVASAVSSVFSPIPPLHISSANATSIAPYDSPSSASVSGASSSHFRSASQPSPSARWSARGPSFQPFAQDFSPPVYTHSKQLHKEIEKQWARITKHTDIQLKPPKHEAEIAYAAYCNAMSPGSPIVVLGGEAMRQDMELIFNMGTLATDPQVNRKHIAKHISATHKLPKGKVLNLQVDKHVTTGAIVNDSNWWIFRNDLFMLGAIHAGKELHLCYKGIGSCERGIPPKALLWDNKHARPRALGREILMAAAAGYRPTYYKKGLSFTPPVVNNRYTYTQMRDIVENCDYEKIERFLEQSARFQLTPTSSPSPSSQGAQPNWSSRLSPSPTPPDNSGRENKGNPVVDPDSDSG
jgi:hypothetical protein